MAQLFGIQKVDAGYTTRKLGIGRVIKGEKLVEVVGHQGSNLEQGGEARQLKVIGCSQILLKL